MSSETGQENSRPGTIVAVAITVVALSFSTVLLRLISRLVLIRRATLDDLFIVVAWLIALAMSIAMCLGTHYGLGKHDQYIHMDWRGILNRLQYVSSVLYNPALMATKTSILIFYLRLTSAARRFFKLATITILVVVNVAGCVLTVLNIIQCLPIDAAFQYPQPSGARCIGILNLSLASAPVNIITDLAILFLPLPIFTSLGIPRKQKIVLVFVFATGVFVTAVDVVRIAYLQQASQMGLHWGNLNDTSDNNMTDPNFFWYASQSLMWSIVEVNIGITCACIPTLKPVVSWAACHLPLRSWIWTSRQELLSTSRQQFEMEERGSTMEWRKDTLVDRRNNRQADNRTEPEGEPLPQFLQSDIDLGTTQSPGILFGDSVGSSSSGKMTQLEIRVTYALYYCGYFVAPATFGWIVLPKYSFKATIITGLCIYSCGVLIFWPSAILGSLPAFMISNLIVGTGIATLEMGINPFVALCGRPEFPEARLNFSYFVRGLGGTISLFVVREPIFGSQGDPRTLVIAQWEYLGLAVLCIASMLVLYYLPLPDASDADLASQSSGWRSIGTPRIGRFSVTYVTLAFGIATQLCYKPVESSIAMIEVSYMDSLTKAGAQACLTAGRLVASIAMIFLKPRHILAFSQFASVAAAVAAFRADRKGIVADTMLVLFFISPIYPTTMGTCLRGLGSRIKPASVLILAASSSAAIVISVLGILLDRSTCRRAWLLMVGLLIPMIVFPLYLNLTPAARKQVDPVKDKKARRVGSYLKDVHEAAGQVEGDIASLSSEIQNLESLNKPIKHLHETEVESLPDDAKELPDLDRELWRITSSNLRDCQETAKKLEIVLDGIAGKHGNKVAGWRDGIRKQLRKQSKDGELNNMSLRVSLNRQSLHTSLTMLDLLGFQLHRQIAALQSKLPREEKGTTYDSLALQQTLYHHFGYWVHWDSLMANTPSFWGVFTIDASSQETAQQSFETIARLCKIDANERAARSWLSSSERPWLLLVNNADDPKLELEKYLPEGEHGLTIITTRNPSIKTYGTIGQGFYHFSKLDDTEASQLLLKAAECLEAPTPPIVKWAATITTALGCLPLALVHTGAAIKNKYCGWERYLTYYERSWKTIRENQQLSRNGEEEKEMEE
ncbi:uncharacterized protein PAC_15098 [Phialocephala subalpina]|uniref:Rhodopsin domain-containing protein n=1 Tax=Phialocephala subalpina TaxID=576137 RepID=A0A1L7XJK5_9HELO|nr:uncharacterized protein PAC_15098 [Phialocephala subalpina]